MEQAALGTTSAYPGQEAGRSDRFSGSVPLQHYVAPLAVVVAPLYGIAALGARAPMAAGSLRLLRRSKRCLIEGGVRYHDDQSFMSHETMPVTRLQALL